MSGKPRTSQRQRQAVGQRRGQHDGRLPGRQPAAPASGGKTAPAAGRKTVPAADRKAKLAAARQAQARAARRRKTGMRAAIALGAAGVAAVLFAIFSGASHSGSGAYPYQAASPSAGQAAPGFTLASSTGGRISLSQYRGKSVLLFFQEGLTCQPCWNQITDLQQHAAQLKAAGISQVVSITTDPVGAITQKARDMGLTIPVLSDPVLVVSRAYHANVYTMMGSSRDGHTFILVRPDGVIRWRADYGGPPRYTMFLPTAALLAGIKAGEHPA
jgi:peroxiredoxin Q/BCP